MRKHAHCVDVAGMWTSDVAHSRAPVAVNILAAVLVSVLVLLIVVHVFLFLVSVCFMIGTSLQALPFSV